MPPERHTKDAQPTAMLVNLCLTGSPDPVLLEKCIAVGADVHFQPESFERPILHQFLWNGDRTSVQVCFRSCPFLDFTTVDKYGYTPLHCLCYEQCPTTSTELLKLVIERLNTHPNDKIQWEQKDTNGHDFISWVAGYQKLSQWWPLLQAVPYFANSNQLYVISLEAEEHDWNQLTQDDQQRFVLEKGFYTSVSSRSSSTNQTRQPRKRKSVLVHFKG